MLPGAPEAPPPDAPRAACLQHYAPRNRGYPKVLRFSSSFGLHAPDSLPLKPTVRQVDTTTPPGCTRRRMLQQQRSRSAVYQAYPAEHGCPTCSASRSVSDQSLDACHLSTPSPCVRPHLPRQLNHHTFVALHVLHGRPAWYASIRHSVDPCASLQASPTTYCQCVQLLQHEGNNDRCGMRPVLHESA